MKKNNLWSGKNPSKLLLGSQRETKDSYLEKTMQPSLDQCQIIGRIHIMVMSSEWVNALE